MGGNVTGIKPRTLMVELSIDPGRFFMIMPSSGQVCRGEPAYWYLVVRARCQGLVGKYIIGKISADEKWLEEPKILDSVLEAGYINPISKRAEVVDVPAYILDEVLELTRKYSFKIRIGCAFNRNAIKNACFS